VNRYATPEAAIVTSKMSSREAIQTTSISAIPDNNNELPLSTICLSTPVGVIKEMAVSRSARKQEHIIICSCILGNLTSTPSGEHSSYQKD
jgi:hypothetical protein